MTTAWTWAGVAWLMVARASTTALSAMGGSSASLAGWLVTGACGGCGAVVEGKGRVARGNEIVAGGRGIVGSVAGGSGTVLGMRGMNGCNTTGSVAGGSGIVSGGASIVVGG